MSGKYALIIGNTEYTDPGLAQLSAPGKDAEDFARVLKDIEIGAFDSVNVLVNEPSASVIEAIDEFFDQKKPDDMLVLYFSGHGIRDEIGSLYLAFKNTIRSRLRSTAIKSDYIKEAMDQSRSKRQVLILDCCNSGAFPQGTKAELGGAMGMTKAFQGYGRFVLTASDATQFAWEGDKLIGETDNSLFTHFLVKGLEGEADSDGDGRITVDELYDYAYDQISRVTPKQTPTKSSSKVEGEIVLRQSTRIENIKPMPLPAELMDEIEDTRPYVREAAVQKLEKIIKGRNIGLAHSAREALEKIVADENTTRRVAQTATQALESFRQAEETTRQKASTEQKALNGEEVERIVIPQTDIQQLMAQKTKERLERKKTESERKEENLTRSQTRAVTTEKTSKELKSRKDLDIARQRKNKPFLFYIGSALGLTIIGLGIITMASYGYSRINNAAYSNASATAYYAAIQATNAANATARASEDALTAEAQAITLTSYYLTVDASDTEFASNNVTIDAATQFAYEATNAQATQDAKSYYDIFDDNSGNWFLGDWNSTGWDGVTSIENGTFLINVTQARDGFSQRIRFPGHISADFDMTVDTLSESYFDTADNLTDIFCHGVYFRTVSNSYYEFDVCDQYYRVSYFDGNSWNDINKFSESTAIRPSDWNTLRVIAIDSNFELYINGVNVYSFSDSRNENGDIGFWFATRPEKSPGEILFDNFILNNIE